MKKITIIILALLSTTVKSQVTNLNSWNRNGNALSSNANIFGTTTNRSVLFYTNNLKRMKLDSTGTLAIGQSTVLNLIPSFTGAKLAVSPGANQGITAVGGHNFGGAIWLVSANNYTNISGANLSLNGTNNSMAVNHTSSLVSASVRLNTNNVPVISINGNLSGTLTNLIDVRGQAFTNQLPQPAATFSASPIGREFSGGFSSNSEYVFGSNVLSATVASTIDTVFGGDFKAPSAGGNMTFNEKFALRSDGDFIATGSATFGGSLAVVSISATGSSTFANIQGRWIRRAPTITQAAAPAINTDVTDLAIISGLAQNITSLSTNLTGTPYDGQLLEIRIRDNGTARTITYGASFTNSGNVTAPTTTVINTWIRIYFEWDGATWVCVGFA